MRQMFLEIFQWSDQKEKLEADPLGTKVSTNSIDLIFYERATRYIKKLRQTLILSPIISGYLLYLCATPESLGKAVVWWSCLFAINILTTIIVFRYVRVPRKAAVKSNLVKIITLQSIEAFIWGLCTFVLCFGYESTSIIYVFSLLAVFSCISTIASSLFKRAFIPYLILIWFGPITYLFTLNDPEYIQLAIIATIAVLGLLFILVINNYETKTQLETCIRATRSVKKLKSIVAQAKGEVRQHRLAAKRAKKDLMYDDLTNAYSRRYGIKQYEIALCEQQRCKENFSLVLIDLDHFKLINDNYGHRSGDEVLKKFVSHINMTLRQLDTLARYGGEEFLIVLRRTNLKETIEIVNRMKDAMNELQIKVEENEFIQVTFSAGIIEVQQDEVFSRAVERVDKNLYIAKNRGRNQYYPSRIPNKFAV